MHSQIAFHHTEKCTPQPQRKVTIIIVTHAALALAAFFSLRRLAASAPLSVSSA